MIFKKEYKFILEMKRIFENFYKFKFDKNNENIIHIDTNIDENGFKKILIDIKNQEHSGIFFLKQETYIKDVLGNINYKLIFDYKYYVEHKKILFFKYKTNYKIDLTTYLKGNFYGNVVNEHNIYKDVNNNFKDILRFEDIVLYTKSLYYKHHGLQK